MAQISKGDTFVDGQQVTGVRLNQLVDSSTLLVGAVSDQTPVTANSLLATDTTLLANGNLRKATIGDILNSNLPVTTSAITGGTAVDIIITPSAGQKVGVAGELTVSGISVLQSKVTASGDIDVGGYLNSVGTGAIKLPVGTTAERPATPAAGQLRYNSTLDTAEVYSGTEWKAAGGLPFDASGGTITSVDGYTIHTFTASGTFTPTLTRDGKIEVLVVGGGGGGGGNATNVGAGGGGGGAVLFGTFVIAKNTAPMAVVVGAGGANLGGNGGISSFHTITAGGGLSPANSGGSINAGGAAGSGALAGTGTGGYGTNGAAAGDALEGCGSRLSMTNITTYGGGGGGGGGNTSSIGGTGVNGGGTGRGSASGSGVAPRVNSGGGGGGAASSIGGGGGFAGAAGVVIIRYRVS